MKTVANILKLGLLGIMVGVVSCSDIFAMEGVKILGDCSLEPGTIFQSEAVDIQSVEIRWKLTNLKGVAKGDHRVFSIQLFDDAGQVYNLSMMLAFDGTSYSFNDQRYENIKVKLASDISRTVAESDSAGVELQGANPVKFSSLKIEKRNEMLTIYTGETEYQQVYRSSFPGEIKRIVIEPDRVLDISSIYMLENLNPPSRLLTGMDESWATQRRQMIDPQSIEGVYRYLDSDLNDKRVVKGGDYTLYLHPVDGGGYELIYLSGAHVNSSMWKSGMMKGRLHPTRFENHYELEWFDADGADDFDELWAEFSAGPILTIHFPLENSQLRFYKADN